MRNLFAALVLFLAAAPAFTAEKEVRVGLYVNSPFVIDLGSGNYSGLAFNLWELIAERHDLRSEYILYHSLKQVLEDAHSGEIDIVVGNITVSYDRAKNLKFCYPWYDDGLRILVKRSGQRLSTWDILQQRGHTGIYKWIALLIVLLTLGQAWSRRRKDADFAGGWLGNVSVSLYDVLRSAKSGALYKNVLGWTGYIILAVWMLLGSALLAYVTSTLTSAMTAAGMFHAGDINSLNDLPGRRVAVAAHSIGEKYMRKTGARLLRFEMTEEIVEALMEDDADAVVMDAAELEYWVHSNPQMDVEIVGNTFNPCKYAFAANKKYAHLMDLASEELIRLLDDGTVEGLKDVYFGRVRF